MTCYLGVDNGLGGAMCLIDAEGNIIDKILMPVIEVKKGKGQGTRRKYDATGIAQWITTHSMLCKIALTAVEDIIAMPSQSSSSTISVGYGHGLIIGVLTALRLPHIIVRPPVWQKIIFQNVQSGGDSKEKSIQFATQTKPLEDWKETPRCRGAFDGLTDSFAIAEYCRRQAK